MDIKALLAGMADKLPNLIFTGIHVLFIALVFEIIAWWLGRRIESMTSGLMGADAGRAQDWRFRRRATLRQTPKIISRTLCYTVALILVFEVFGVPVLPLSLAIGAVALLFGAALLPQMRDAAQGYALLSEDALAVGDTVSIDGHEGVVEKFNLRGVWLRDSSGRAHCLANRAITSVVVHTRKAEAPDTVVASVPAAAAPASSAPPVAASVAPASVPVASVPANAAQTRAEAMRANDPLHRPKPGRTNPKG